MRKLVLTRSSENVASRELPHSGEQLRETTAEDGHANDNIRCGDAPRL
jgi:hypothetical protein